jgi:hypothetical protein
VIAEGEKTVQTPDAFKSLCRSFYQGVDEVYLTKEDMIRSAVSELTTTQKSIVKEYLIELMSGKYDEEQLWNIWENAGARIRITDGTPGMSAKFLGLIRAALNN